MKGFNMTLKEQVNNFDRHIFRAPANVVLPDAVGKYSFISNDILFKYIIFKKIGEQKAM